MVVCVCNAIREAEVRDAVRKGASCPYSAYQSLGRRPKCGQCGLKPACKYYQTDMKYVVEEA